MNEYQRFISYIYSYPGNVRDKNVGFAKIEVRNGQCRLDMSLSNVYTDSSQLYGVYIMVENAKEELAGNQKRSYQLIGIGHILVQGGQGKYRDLLNPDNLAGSGYGLSQVMGLAVADQEDSYYRMFSLWNDETFYPENVYYREEKTSVSEPEGISVERSAFAAPPESEVQLESPIHLESETQLESEEQLESEAQLESEGRKDPKVTLEVETEPADALQAEADFQPERKQVETVELEGDILRSEHMLSGEVHAASTTMTESMSIGDVLRWLIDKGNLIDAFDDDMLYDCIEVTPEQLKKIVKSNEIFDKNSFMMHGYYRFHHLLFGRVQENDNNTHYFIGVPGMYCNRERYMASMFGFSNFKKSHRCDYTNPYFGYWYQEI